MFQRLYKFIQLSALAIGLFTDRSMELGEIP